MITQHYMIDLIPAGDPVVVHVSQYDKLARILAFDLYTGGVAFEPPAGATAQIRGTKPDGTVFNYAMTVDGITVSTPIPQQMALVAGDVPCEIQIVGDGGAQIGTANFLLKVERSALDEEAAESSSDIPLFEQLTQQAMEAASDAAASAQSAESLIPGTGTVGQVLTKTATGTAWEDAHGGDVQTVDGFEPDTNGAVTTERVLTQAQYDALSTAEKNNGMTYYISDGEGGGLAGRITLTYSDTEVTTNDIGEVYLGEVNSLITAFDISETEVRWLRLHTYSTSIYGKLYDISGNVVANHTFTVRRIYATPAFV